MLNLRKPLLLLAFLAGAMLSLQAQEQKPGQVVRLDPALDQIVSSSAKIEKLADGFGFLEGPIWSKEGYLLFSDIPKNTIHKWEPNGKVSVFRQPSNNANGLFYDQQGRLVMCEHGSRQVTRMEKDGKITVLADKYEGKRLNSPNDLVVKSDGAIYFTDPPWGLQKTDDSPDKELVMNGVYRLHNGKLQVVEALMHRPNGLAFSPDEKYLYVGNVLNNKEVWHRYEVQNDGTLRNGKIFFDASKHDVRGNPDGLRVDVKGNLYATGPGGIWIISPEGKALGRVEFPELPANCAWGDKDGKTMYVTARTGLYRIRFNNEGVRPK
jgi:gluconolactonase